MKSKKNCQLLNQTVNVIQVIILLVAGNITK